MAKMTDEIDAMNKTFSDLFDGKVQTDPPVTDEPDELDVETEPPDQDIQTDPPEGDKDELKTDAPRTEPPATEGPKTDAPTTDAPDEKDLLIADLRNKLAEKEGEISTKAPTTLPPLEVEEQDFIGDIDLTDMDKDTFNKLLNSVYSKGMTEGRKIIHKDVSSNITDQVSSEIDLKNEMERVRDQFFDENEDLAKFPKVVSVVFKELAQANPKKLFSDIMNEVAPEARKRLGLKEPTNEDKGGTNKSTRKPPNLPRRGGRSGKSTNQPKPNRVNAEIDAMNKTLGR